MKKTMITSTIITLVAMIFTAFAGMITEEIIISPIPFSALFISFFVGAAIVMIVLALITVDALAWELHNDEIVTIDEIEAAKIAAKKAAISAAEYAERCARIDAERRQRAENEKLFGKYATVTMWDYTNAMEFKYLNFHKNFCHFNGCRYLGVIETEKDHKNDVIFGFNSKDTFKAAIRAAVRNNTFYKWEIIDKNTWHR